MLSERQTSTSRYDAVVVGARCAGAATALLLARAGLRVLAVDRQRHGADTLSTHALMRTGVLQLHRWGVLGRIAAAGTPAIRRTAFHYGDEVVDLEITARDGVDALYAPRRTVLDAALADAAWEAGAEVRYGVRVTGLLRRPAGAVDGVVLETGDCASEHVRADLVIGADGLRSTVPRQVAAPTVLAGRHASGVVYGYFADTGIDTTHWHFAPGSGAGAIPTNRGETCVFAASTDARYRDEMRSDLEAGFRRVLAECAPDLADAVAGREPAGGLRGFGGAAGHLRRAWGPGWALVGDAGSFKDPITAHGISAALRDAELLARAVATGSEAALARFEAARDELSRPLLELSDRIASYRWTLGGAQQLHLELSRVMNRELEVVRGFDRRVATAA